MSVFKSVNSSIFSREEVTQIRIDKTGVWYTGDLKITNQKILLFFRKNLHRDKKGIYIFNTFGKFSEKGYIKIEGPLLKIIDISKQYLLLNNGEKIVSESAEIILNQELTPYLKLPKLKAWAILSSNSAVQFGEIIKESYGVFSWFGSKVEVLDKINWS